VYAYYKLKPFLPQYQWLLILILAALGCSVFLVEALTHGNIETRLAVPMAYVTFAWMGIIFMFFILSVSIDLVAWTSGKFGAQQFQATLVSPARTIVTGIIVVMLAGYGYLASLQVHVEKLSFTSSKITSPVQIVQISDLHLGLLSDEHYFQKVVDAINAMDVDIIVCTGDLVDMQMDHLDGLGKLMSSLRARHGKYAIFGNHEALAGITESRAFIERVGFTLLSNSGITIDNAINLVGVDDPSVQGRMHQSNVNEQALLRQFDNGLYTILLKHQPVIEEKSAGYFDLQLSGHTHGGQIFPFGMLIHLFYKAPFGLSKLGDNSWLYVSRGTGTWGPPMRVCARPEITLIQLEGKGDSQ